jgi:peptide/nickel transport system permease protein
MAAVLQRLADTLVTLLLVAGQVFALIHLIPGDPVDVMLGESAVAADRAALRAELGLDLPLWRQLLHFYAGLLHGDLGSSLHQGRPVAALIGERLPATAQLALAALALTLAVSLPLGVLAARRAGRWPDKAASGIALLGLSIPNFWLGPLLILAFSIGLGLTPVSGRDAPLSLLLPALTLGLSIAALNTRMVRASLLEVLGQPFVRTARAKGLSEGRAVWRHALPNAALPVLTLLGLQLGYLLAGAVITETVFAWPGIGTLLVDAIRQRDYPVVQGCVLFISSVYVLVNTFTDLAYGWLDPRTRRGE